MMHGEIPNLTQAAIILLGPAISVIEPEADALDQTLPLLPTGKLDTPLRLALRDLRHLYEQMLTPGAIWHQTQAALGLLDPALRLLDNEIEVQAIKGKLYADA